MINNNMTNITKTILQTSQNATITSFSRMNFADVTKYVDRKITKGKIEQVKEIKKPKILKTVYG